MMEQIQDKPTIRQNGVKMKKRRILIIDDEVTFTNALKLTLEISHFE